METISTPEVCLNIEIWISELLVCAVTFVHNPLDFCPTLFGSSLVALSRIAAHDGVLGMLGIQEIGVEVRRKNWSDFIGRF